MTTSTPTRLGGLALVLGAVLAFSPISPGKDASLALDPTWTPGHLIDLSSYLFLLLGLPTLVPATARGSGPLATLGYAAFVTRLALSVGSQLYEARVVPVLARQSSQTPALADHGNLNSIYGSSGAWVNVALSMGGVLFGIALWRSAPKTRWVAGLIAVGSAAAAVVPPLGIVLFSVGFGWLGLRILLRRDALTPLRSSHHAAIAAQTAAPGPLIPNLDGTSTR